MAISLFLLLVRYNFRMDSFIVSARKYRPASFDMVVGQKSITNTLKNAIRNNHLAQSFLFNGPRGVGKTTCARILAKTINCENHDEKVEACDHCEPCKAFNESSAFNVHELDAASNNSVDDIRKLVDQVRIPPQIGKYKVYIIDEVHMLSTQAFNAFLKTLEEPPGYAKFILATTEKHKIIPTILSRCQIFDFARITVDDIARQLHFVAQKEGVDAEHNALHIIARKADGALRDALSIFDQMVSFSGNNLTYKQVIENLNVLDYDYYFRITEMLLKGQSTEILLLINEILHKGFEGSEFITGFGEHLRHLLISQSPATVKLIEVSDDIRDFYLRQGTECRSEFLLRALEINNQADIQYKESNNKRLTLELALLQMAALSKKKSLELTPEKPILAQPEPLAVTQNPQPKPPEPAPVTKPVVAGPLSTAPLPSFSEAQRVEEDAPITTAPKIEIKHTPTRHTYKPLSLKIRDTDQPPKSEEEIQENYEDLPNDSVSIIDFLEAWKELAKTYMDQSQSLFTAMTIHEPTLSHSGMIKVSIDNAIQENLINERKTELLGFLRKKLNNYALQLETSIVENSQQQIAYLPKEKLERMIERNPDVEKLQKDLDLDLLY